MASEVKSENDFMQVLSNPQNLGKFYAVRVLNTCHIQGDPPKIDLEILWIAVNLQEYKSKYWKPQFNYYFTSSSNSYYHYTGD